jgi:hypothetical protein
LPRHLRPLQAGDTGTAGRAKSSGPHSDPVAGPACRAVAQPASGDHRRCHYEVKHGARRDPVRVEQRSRTSKRYVWPNEPRRSIHRRPRPSLTWRRSAGGDRFRGWPGPSSPPRNSS